MIEKARGVLGTTGASEVVTHSLERQGILNLLSDQEIARVSTAEAAAQLALGDEYLDLAQLEKGVSRVTGIAAPLGRLLPKRAVYEDTWTKILTHLSSMPLAATPAR